MTNQRKPKNKFSFGQTVYVLERLNTWFGIVKYEVFGIKYESGFSYYLKKNTSIDGSWFCEEYIFETPEAILECLRKKVM